MKHKKFILSALILFSLALTTANAQQSINSSGGEASGSGGSASYSLGQIVYKTSSGINGSSAQGVQQPFEISITSGIQEQSISLNLSAYPNPASDFLVLNVKENNFAKLSFQLLDSRGRILESGPVRENSTTISLDELASATYFLKVTQNNKEIKTFKIIKN